VTDVNLKLVIATARCYNTVFSRIEKNVQEYGLNISEFGVLEMLLHKGEQPVQKIAEKILVTSGTITYVLDKLQKKELICRKKCDKDKRIFYISLTQKGEELITGAFAKHKKFLDDLFCSLDDNIKNDIVSNMFTLVDTLDDQVP
jgi:MarR family 2-MHQ and catechol resistance regulon transcriptional repressor